MTPSESCTKFSLNDKIFYIYLGTRRKNSEILYKRTLKSIMKLIFWKFLGGEFFIPKKCDVTSLFPTRCHMYDETSDETCAIYFDTERVYNLNGVSIDVSGGECLDMYVSGLSDIELVESKLDYGLFERYLVSVHDVTNIYVLGNIINEEFEEWKCVIREVGVDKIEIYMKPSPEHCLNYYLVMRYITDNELESIN